MTVNGDLRDACFILAGDAELGVGVSVGSYQCVYWFPNDEQAKQFALDLLRHVYIRGAQG